ncbi:unnamed protein product [Porites evermanni]|uniref:Uncharacterized protein n=1 Tax=Porites evermanni TaxID=104178 RepID=A0ABN8M9G9_9CNID|nr:unnamed protein product [Porites evermanni]
MRESCWVVLTFESVDEILRWSKLERWKANTKTETASFESTYKEVSFEWSQQDFLNGVLRPKKALFRACLHGGAGPQEIMNTIMLLLMEKGSPAHVRYGYLNMDDSFATLARKRLKKQM